MTQTRGVAGSYVGLNPGPKRRCVAVEGAILPEVRVVMIGPVIGIDRVFGGRSGGFVKMPIMPGVRRGAVVRVETEDDIVRVPTPEVVRTDAGAGLGVLPISTGRPR